MMETKPFSLKNWAIGCFVTFLFGSMFNMAAIMIGLRINVTAIATLLGLLPGIGLIVASRRSADPSFAKGALVGAIAIAILGGACAAIFTATQVKP